MLNNFVKGHFDSYEDFANNLNIIVPRNFNFAYDVADRIARENPHKKALVWCNDKGQEEQFTFGEIKNFSDKTANLLNGLGIKKGDPVMLILKRHYQFWFCLLALHKIGAIAIPATHLLKTKDIIYRNNAAGIKMIISCDEPEVIDNINAAQKDSPTLEHKVCVGKQHPGWVDFTRELEKASDKFLRPAGKNASQNNDILLLYFTSGTTGMPKMVQHNFTYPLGHILTAKYWQNVALNGLHLTVADTGWAKAAWGKIYGQWLAGSAVFVYDYDKFIPRDLLGVISRYEITTFCAPPTIYRYLIKEDIGRYNLKGLKYCVVAGEPLNPEVYSQFLKLTGIRLMEGFGQTECTVAIATYPWMKPKPGSMGKPSPGYDIDLINDAGESCQAGEEGQIAIHTDKQKPVGMFDGYFRDPKLTKSVWHDGIYYTGDMAWRDEDGYYWFVGRSDDLIKSSGYRIGPFEVESALLEHPAVLECAITAVPDPERGQIVKASVVLTKNYKSCPELVQQLQDHVKKITAPYKYPRIIEFVTELPKTISGKIRRVELRNSGR
ncbi:MAG: AMP-binding protein [Candidatus Omnitrophica bacterium]|jgi:acetyl-CoA synthetase|nr:AMP-binding protein [Candidatus Omnitrophota bacterium]MDD5079960.1 AMP-binding protein [Candidatus Omnitrophota bacterium]